MDKIFSSRVDESAIHRIDTLSRQLKISKKAIIEEAIKLYAQKIDKENDFDILEETLGAWHRKEPPDKTVSKTRKTFNNSMNRHQK